ncbi:MAG: Panacea domain-containing protein [Terracidiphilus sp.]|jgi:hypothetical protein
MRFDEAKTTEAAARIVRFAGGRMSYMGLLKYLYVADRISLERRGRSITGDTYVAMHFGPVLSRTKDLITNRAFPPDQGIWKKTFERVGKYDIKLVSEPSWDNLSESDEEILRRTFQKYARFAQDQFGFANFLHENFPEVEEIPTGSSRSLPIESVLQANSNSGAIDEQMLAEMASQDSLDDFFERVGATAK